MEVTVSDSSVEPDWNLMVAEIVIPLIRAGMPLQGYASNFLDAEPQRISEEFRSDHLDIERGDAVSQCEDRSCLAR